MTSEKHDADTVERVRLAIIDASLTVNREARDMDHARALGALSAMAPQEVSASIDPLGAPPRIFVEGHCGPNWGHGACEVWETDPRPTPCPVWVYYLGQEASVQEAARVLKGDPR